MSDNNLSERCKACDALFATHYDEERNCYEDLCPECRYEALKGEDDGELDAYHEWCSVLEIELGLSTITQESE